MEICHNHDASIAYCDDEYSDCPLCQAVEDIAELKREIERLKDEFFLSLSKE